MVSPDDEEAKQVEALETPSEPAEPPADVPRQAPQKRKRSFFGALFSTLLLLVLIAGVGLYAAIVFKDKDERLKLVADYAEPYVVDASGAFERLKDNIGSLLGETKPPPQTKVTTHRTAPAEAEAPEPEPAIEPPPQRAETTPEPAPPPQRAEIAPEPTPAPAMPAAETPKAGSALESRIDALEESAQKALRAAEAAQAAAESAAKASQAVKPADHGALTAGDQLTALEGRIDELGEEIKALRERLDSPKNETRAAPDAAAAAKTPDGSAAVVVVAYALQRELDAGRPYADEVAALTRLGADPAQLAILSPLSEKGAPTAAQLKAEFAPAAKRIRTLEGAHGTGDFTEHLMQGASKLVRVRPSGQSPATAQTLEEKVAKIEAALTHGDVYGAGAAFSALPEAAQGEAKEFGEALRARVDAGRAADGLLHGAIAALGGAKK